MFVGVCVFFCQDLGAVRPNTVGPRSFKLISVHNNTESNHVSSLFLRVKLGMLLEGTLPR